MAVTLSVPSTAATSNANCRLVLVGNPDPVHVGAHFCRAGTAIGLSVEICDSTEAYRGVVWTRKFNWCLRGRRPANLRAFSDRVLQLCADSRPSFLLTTGLAPVAADALRAIGEMGIVRLTYLTDDPWNRAHYAPWFLLSLPHYDRVFSPRRAVFDDLHAIGCRDVNYLPFGYDPDIHTTADASDALASDLVFVGGADRDRVPYMSAAIRAGYRVALYGGYWSRYRATAPCARGYADAASLRTVIRSARVALCLVRRANRDGHVMRSFEVPAIGACMLTEDTEEHRAIFGPEGEAVLYFRAELDMLAKLRWLLEHDRERERLADAARRIVTTGRNTYRDRLEAMLQ